MWAGGVRWEPESPLIDLAGPAGLQAVSTCWHSWCAPSARAAQYANGLPLWSSPGQLSELCNGGDLQGHATVCSNTLAWAAKEMTIQVRVG